MGMHLGMMTLLYSEPPHLRVLVGMVTQLTTENAALRHQLAGSGQAPAGAPTAAGVQMPPGSRPPPPFAYPPPFGRPGMLFPQPPMFPGAPVPKVQSDLAITALVTRAPGLWQHACSGRLAIFTEFHTNIILKMTAF